MNTILSLGFILLNVGLAVKFNLSVLLSSMFFGAFLVNVHLASFKFFDSIQTIDSPLFLLFFVLAGANLEISLLGKLGLMGLVYVIFRVLGKVLGAGWGLVPQAGVALGCALIAKNDFPEIGNMLFSTIIATTVVYELIGPVCTKYALQKAGEIAIKH